MSKRPHATDDDISTKKQKSDASAAPSALSVAKSSLSTEEIIKQKRAEIAAKMAAMTNAQPTFPSSTKPAIPSAADLARRVAEAKQRVAEKNSRIAKSNPYLLQTGPGKKKGSASGTPTPELAAPQGAGLNMAAHPLLLDSSTPAPQSKKDRYKPIQPKFASTLANARNAQATPPPPMPVIVPTPVIPDLSARANPYAAGLGANASKDDTASGSFEGAAPKERGSRQFRFNQKGKYVAQAEQMRKEQQLEALKQKIAEKVQTAGVEGVARNIRRDAPPSSEWWDEGLLPNKSYEDIPVSGDLSRTKIRTVDSPITLYIQHPIKIPGAGSASDNIALKPLMLTTKERKKMRKQRRAAELQDHRDRVRMGLIPPDAPKVRLTNLMKVLTSDAVQDPTRVEARVRRQVAERRHKHDKTNAERKLTDEQRRAKVEAKKAEEERRGLVGAAFRVQNLTDPAHQFKVRKNAEQNGFTGVVLLNSNASLVYVEGAAKFMRRYVKLMLERIHWTEAARARGDEDVEVDEENSNGNADEAHTSNAAVALGKNGSGSGAAEGAGADDLSNNRCDLFWQGALRERAFPNFRQRAVATDAMAKEALGPKLVGIWDQCKNWKPEEIELV